MPIAMLYIAEGRDMEKKRRLIGAVTEAIASSLEARATSIRVILHEVSPQMWAVGHQTLAERRKTEAASEERQAS